MKFRIFSIFAGIGQAIALFVFLQLLLFLFEGWIDDWILVGNSRVVIATFFLACAIVLLPYPLYLFRRKQKNDAIVILTSSIVSVGIGLFLLYLMASQLAVID